MGQIERFLLVKCFLLAFLGAEVSVTLLYQHFFYSQTNEARRRSRMGNLITYSY